MRTRARCFVACTVLALVACENKDKAAETNPATEASLNAPAVPPPAPPPQPAPEPVDLSKAEAPTEAEFEAEAEQTISAKNLDQELDKLEKEIGATP